MRLRRFFHNLQLAVKKPPSNKGQPVSWRSRSREERGGGSRALRSRRGGLVFAENEDQIVRGHGDAFSEAKAMPGAQGRQVVQAADPPFGIASPQALVELDIAGGGRDTAFDERAIEEQAAA
jgi:hypothetical protein